MLKVVLGSRPCPSGRSVLLLAPQDSLTLDSAKVEVGGWFDAMLGIMSDALMGAGEGS